MHTDLDESAAREAARECEAAYSNLEQVAFPGYEHMAQRMNVVVFRSAGEFHHFWPRDMAGLYMDQAPLDLERAPTIVLHGTLTGDARIVFLHELTHRLIARAYGWAPVWLSEGLADYFSTMYVEGARVVLGTVPPGRLIAPNLIPSVHEIVAADRAAFYGAWTGDDDGALHRARYYAGAYALVHLLRNGTDEQRAAFDAFIRVLNDGARADQAWARTLGQVPDDTFERVFRAHLAAYRGWDLFGAPVRPLPGPAAEHVETMSDAEVHLLWARLIHPSGDGLKMVKAELDAAFAQAPASPQVAYERGCFELSQGRASEARVLFEAALVQQPDSPRYLYAVTLARLLAGDRAEALAEALERLGRVAKSADELGVVADYDLSRGGRDAALRHAEAAVAADPGYAGALAVRARVHFEAGDFAAAISDQERALAVLPEQGDDRRLLQTLAEYRRAQPNGAPPSKSDPSSHHVWVP